MSVTNRCLMVIVAIAALAACAAPQPEIRSDFDRNVDFSAFRTYNIMLTAGQNTTGDGYGTLVGQRIRAAVEREMESRGYVKDQAPDLLVNFTLTVQSVQKVTQVPSQNAPRAYYYRGGYYRTWNTYSYDTWVREYDEGTLLIDIVDAQRQQLVWEAAGTGRLKGDLSTDIEARANRAVALLFERYPFRAGL